MSSGSCGGSQKSSATKDTASKESYKEVFAKKFPSITSKQTTFLASEDGSYMLCMAKDEVTASRPEHSVSFFVYDMKNNQIVYEQSYSNATISWVSPEKIQVNIIPGIVKKEGTESYGYIYDVRNKSKTSLNSGSEIEK